MTNTTPSKYQNNVLELVKENERRVAEREARRNIVIHARAGAGKTTTIKLVAEYLAQRHVSMCYLAYNASVVEEVKDKMPSTMKIKTAHALGKETLTRTWKKCKFNKNKLWNLKNDLSLQHNESVRLVRLMKDHAVGLVDTQLEDLIEHYGALDDVAPEYHAAVLEETLTLFKASNDEKTSYDFSDMIYFPLAHGLVFEQFDYVFVDEAQDTNPARMLLYRRLLKPWGCIVAVGDEHQAIYGFSGADTEALERFRDNALIATLPVSYRCGVKIVERAQQYVEDILPRDGAHQGLVKTIEYRAWNLYTLKKDDVVLCRFNAPLVKLFFRLLMKGIPCHIEGKDFITGLAKVAQDIVDGLPSNATKDLAVAHIDQWQVVHEARCRKASSKARVVDQAAVMLVVLEQCDTPAALPDVIRSLCPENTDSLTLSTVHKAKGKEWNTVYLLGANKYMPSRYAKLEWELTQEQNLIYVAITRAINELVYVAI